jgi:hypothetical protein
MAFTGNKGELTTQCAESCGNFVATLYPSGAKENKAQNLLKTKDRKRQFSKNEAENILKTSLLPKTVGAQKFRTTCRLLPGGAPRGEAATGGVTWPSWPCRSTGGTPVAQDRRISPHRQPQNFAKKTRI